MTIAIMSTTLTLLHPKPPTTAPTILLDVYVKRGALKMTVQNWAMR